VLKILDHIMNAMMILIVIIENVNKIILAKKNIVNVKNKNANISNLVPNVNIVLDAVK